MGWELRRGRRVYVRKVRTPDGKVSSVYVGGGEVGERAAREDEERRAAKRAARLAHAETSGDSPSESSETRAAALPPDVQPAAHDLEGGRESGGVAHAALTGEEIIRRGCAIWPHALRNRREEFLRRLLDRGMTNVACRSAGITDGELQKRGFTGASLPGSLLEIAPVPTHSPQSVDEKC